MSYEDIEVARDDGIVTVTLNRPEVRNALSATMVSELGAVLDGLAGDPDARGLVLTGAGGGFCAGGDIGGMKDRRKDDGIANRRRMATNHVVLKKLMNLEMPVVAAVDGAAAGAGCNLALTCDFVVASTRARFIQSFVRMGLVPDYGGFFQLPRIVGIQRAKELMFSGRAVGAEEALALGMVFSVHPQDLLMDAARELAGRFRHASTGAIGLSKSILNQSFNTDYDTVLAMEAQAQSLARTSGYHLDCVERFMGKQPLAFDWDRMDKQAAE